MSCNGSKSTKKGKYNKKTNLQRPTSYTIVKGKVVPVYSKDK